MASGAVPLEPAIIFSTWHKWDEETRRKLQKEALPFSADLEWPGLYAWAVFPVNPPAGQLDILVPPKAIVYIGESKKPLKKRLNQFAKSAFTGVGGHEGARRLFHASNGPGSTLYLAYFSLLLPEENQDFWLERRHWSRPFLHYAERLLLWNYVRQWGHIPEMNNT